MKFVGLIIAFFLLVIWLALPIGGALLLIDNINVQAELDQPQRLYGDTLSSGIPNVNINVAYPTKVVPEGSPSVLFWLSKADESSPLLTSTSHIITISAAIAYPLLISDTNTLTFTVNPETVRAGVAQEIHYANRNLVTDKQSVLFSFDIITDATISPITFDVSSRIDADFIRNRIIAERTLWIIGIALPIFIALVLGGIYSRQT